MNVLRSPVFSLKIRSDHKKNAGDRHDLVPHDSKGMRVLARRDGVFAAG